ncbi:hydrogenase formation protein HypD [Heliorestis acidaminivorans]|uniref:Hydrogenase formation protein HypD n=1 Tax=Heliorestis acidaminivorans TaxID=553427 RepID=A0A6I0F0X0_9FIRM|nr:hydrogenase formation protein HypD [Heliorestis acidaminivorans]KAB2951780.1 hydrogenase formation protein HypD [Heliorestis acidaminivorans]
MLSEQLKRFREPQLAKETIVKVKKSLQALQTYQGHKAIFMEFCGTHTAAFSRTGLRQELKEYVTLLSGPGCPVCVTSAQDVDRIIAFSQIPQAIIATFGDMVKVRGSEMTLQEAKACGSDVRIVYSSLEALEIARENRERPVIFIAVGFETTTPTAALTLTKAIEEGIDNLFLYSLHKATAPALKALLHSELTTTDKRSTNIDGIILPGHVAIITGRKCWDFVVQESKIQATISGFEALDLLLALEDLTQGIMNQHDQVGNAYGRAVSEAGNIVAQQAMEQIFELQGGDWRGLGSIPQSSYKLKKEYAAHDAEKAFTLPALPESKGSSCQCGDILKGIKTPLQCPLFAKSCDPVHPQGPCMVSHEGTCATYYKYERKL